MTVWHRLIHLQLAPYIKFVKIDSRQILMGAQFRNAIYTLGVTHPCYHILQTKRQKQQKYVE